MLTNVNNTCPKFQKLFQPSDLNKNSFTPSFKTISYFCRFRILQKSPEASPLLVLTMGI